MQAHEQPTIAVLHAGPIGLSSALLLARRHQVVLHDTDRTTVELLNARQAPFADPHTAHFLAGMALRFKATQDIAEALSGASLVLVATPTTGLPGKRLVDTTALDRCLRTIQDTLPHAVTVIESAVPVGFTQRRRSDFDFPNLMVAPALVRPRHALWDRLFPARIVVGEDSCRGREHAHRMLRASQAPNTPVQLTGSGEAEAIHLFRQRAHVSQTEPLAGAVVRYALRHGLDPRALLRGLDLSTLPRLDNPITLPPPTDLRENQRHHTPALPAGFATAQLTAPRPPARLGLPWDFDQLAGQPQ